MEAARSALARWRKDRQLLEDQHNIEICGAVEQERRRNVEAIAALEAALSAYEEEQRRQAEAQLSLASQLEDELQQRDAEWREQLQRFHGRFSDHALPLVATAACPS